MPAYLVSLKRPTGLTLEGGADKMVVFAADAADARAVCAGHFHGADAAWAEATATEIAEPADLDDGGTWGLTIQILDSDPVVDETVEGTDLASMYADMVIALNATGIIAGAAYDAGTDVLTVAAAGDNLGDKQVVAKVTYNGVEVPGLLGAVTDEGAAAAALTVATIDAPTLPRVYAAVR